MLCPTPPQQQQPQSLQALARSQSLCLRQSQSPRTSQRCRSLNYNSGNDADYSPDFSNATIEFMIKGLNSLNIKKNLSRLPLLSKGSHDDNSNHYKQQYQTTGSDDSNPTESLLPSVSPHADTDQDEQGNVTRVVFQGSVDSDPSVSPLPCISTQADTDYDGLDSAGSDDNLSDSLLPSSIPRISTDYDEPGNPAVGPSGSNPSESATINIGLQDEHNDFGQPHHRTRVTALELTFMLVGFNLEILSAGFDQVSSTSKPRYALISLLLAVAAVFTCIWELIYNGIKERDASPNSTVFGTLPDFFGLGLAVIQCVCSAVQYYFLHHHHSNPMKLSPVPLFFFTCLVVLKLKGN
ncbi:PREDICTED: serine/threonine-kinase [Prunus dulcis]|uniref:PREDICTED: serine/threonine-kinase n=1 Tax=Prunus dulcis TaxID=3755 RepID=A0A5E4F3U5_PRUDU|nr:uncharacterized protein LOC117613073 isoform X2 [Prunus dulcis]XP_034197606.1 uncharacterized protein LOC117613073 isoform X2 [Prunus dulcis]XP_034212427.1 uncharacterized protein LOC117624985 isoform X1 [Prunus dulcis]XP_034212428.1 uncharacterized protein LOC117624985 isoform X1 [Prunus dulcis]VVA22775.1 PREDICTED: serine/threonine-kinase [Prunus dulcis]